MADSFLANTFIAARTTHESLAWFGEFGGLEGPGAPNQHASQHLALSIYLLKERFVYGQSADWL